MGLIGFSVLFTSVWGVFFDVDSLYLFPIKVAGYEDTNSDLQLGTGAIYFPFSMLYGEFSSEDFVLYRFSGFFREAGIYQAVGCFCLAYESFTRNSKIIKFGLISGIICALSSAGIVMLFLTIGMIYLYGSKFSHKKLIVIIFSFIFLYPAALYTPLIGLNYKKDTHSESITDRVESVDDGINSIKDNFYGNGLFSATKKMPVSI